MVANHRALSSVCERLASRIGACDAARAASQVEAEAARAEVARMTQECAEARVALLAQETRYNEREAAWHRHMVYERQRWEREQQRRQPQLPPVPHANPQQQQQQPPLRPDDSWMSGGFFLEEFGTQVLPAGPFARAP